MRRVSIWESGWLLGLQSSNIKISPDSSESLLNLALCCRFNNLGRVRWDLMYSSAVTALVLFLLDFLLLYHCDLLSLLFNTANWLSILPFTSLNSELTSLHFLKSFEFLSLLILNCFIRIWSSVYFSKAWSQQLSLFSLQLTCSSSLTAFLLPFYHHLNMILVMIWEIPFWTCSHHLSLFSVLPEIVFLDTTWK